MPTLIESFSTEDVRQQSFHSSRRGLLYFFFILLVSKLEKIVFSPVFFIFLYF